MLSASDRLAKANPLNVDRQRALLVSYIKVADVLFDQGNLAEAFEA